MPRWLRVVRGMIGTGLTFAVGVSALVGVLGTVMWIAGGPPFLEVVRTVGKFSVVSFLLGVAFSGVLAVTARGRSFSKLSYRLVGSLGAGAGLLYWLFLAANGGRNWTPRLALLNVVVLIVMGAGSALGMLLIARRARASLNSGDELPELAPGRETVVRQPGSSMRDALGVRREGRARI